MTIPIAVCGAGTMGSGIAQVAAQTNFETVLFDVDETMLEKAKADIAKNLQYLVEKGKMDLQEKHEILHRIKFTSDISDCTAFVIIEAIVEKEKAKICLFTELSKYNNEEVIFASNTSSLSISKIQQQVPFPQRVIGMHFFNPPYIMKLVEVVKGAETNDEVITAIMDICRQMGKVPVLCKDSPGFIVNRVARQYYLESLKIAEEEIASFENIDKILEASGFKMGPFRLMDLIGLDINLATTESIYHAFNETSRFIPSAIQKEKVKQNLLGKKTGRGFYNYKQE
jgi:3-hydroxybutyryl-CoA dehydrogenase